MPGGGAVSMLAPLCLPVSLSVGGHSYDRVIVARLQRVRASGAAGWLLLVISY